MIGSAKSLYFFIFWYKAAADNRPKRYELAIKLFTCDSSLNDTINFWCKYKLTE